MPHLHISHSQLKLSVRVSDGALNTEAHDWLSSMDLDTHIRPSKLHFIIYTTLGCHGFCSNVCRFLLIKVIMWQKLESNPYIWAVTAAETESPAAEGSSSRHTDESWRRFHWSVCVRSLLGWIKQDLVAASHSLSGFMPANTHTLLYNSSLKHTQTCHSETCKKTRLCMKREKHQAFNSLIAV